MAVGASKVCLVWAGGLLFCSWATLFVATVATLLSFHCLDVWVVGQLQAFFLSIWLALVFAAVAVAVAVALPPTLWVVSDFLD